MAAVEEAKAAEEAMEMAVVEEEAARAAAAVGRLRTSSQTSSGRSQCSPCRMRRFWMHFPARHHRSARRLTYPQPCQCTRLCTWVEEVEAMAAEAMGMEVAMGMEEAVVVMVMAGPR